MTVEPSGGSLPPQSPEQAPFKPERWDIAFSLFTFLLGYLFIHWMFLSWRGWGVSLFTLLYCGSAVCYLRKKGVRISSEGRFWLSVTALTGLSYALWAGNGLEPFRGLFLFCTAVYGVIAASGVQILGKTGNWLLLDGLNALFAIPFRNFLMQVRCLLSLRKEPGNGKKVFSVALGILLAFLVLGIVTPLLLEADGGGAFTSLLSGVSDFLERFFYQVTFLEILLSVPVSAYLFGLLFGCAGRRGCDAFSKESTVKAVAGLRLLPAATVYTLLGILCAFYLLFITTQLSYFFSAFSGLRPEGWEVYSDYARRGFFELCAIAGINLSVLTAANLCCRLPRAQSKTLKVFNFLLMLLTLLLIGTAFSKMALYVSAYGLSMRRLLPCVLMLFLCLICAAVIVLQKRAFSILRFAAFTGSVLFCLLCLSDPDGFVVRYNADRYLNGTLASFDLDVVYRAGPAGVGGALKVYEQTNDRILKKTIWYYLSAQAGNGNAADGRASDNLQLLLARNVDLYEP